MKSNRREVRIGWRVPIALPLLHFIVYLHRLRLLVELDDPIKNVNCAIFANYYIILYEIKIDDVYDKLLKVEISDFMKIMSLNKTTTTVNKSKLNVFQIQSASYCDSWKAFECVFDATFQRPWDVHFKPHTKQGKYYEINFSITWTIDT